MKFLKIFIMIFFSFILQTTIFQYFAFWGVIPNTTLIILVCFSLLKGRYKGAMLGMSIGLMQDVIFSDVIGINALIYFVIGYWIGSFDDKVFKDNPLIAFVFTILSTVFYHFMYFVFMYLLLYNISFVTILNRLIIVEMIYNAFLSIIVYKFISKIYKSHYMSFSSKRR